MHPILFQIGSVSVFSYGAMLALGFLAALAVARFFCRRAGFDPDAVSEIGLAALFFGVVGARLAYVGAHWDFYSQNILEMFKLWNGGLVVYGGLVGGAGASLLVLRRRRLPLLKFADILIAAVPVGQAIGRLGCFLNGCCFGGPTDCAIGVVFPADSFAAGRYGPGQAVHAVQLYDAAALAVICVALFVAGLRKKFDGQVLGLYLLLYPLARFMTEFFRGDTPLFSGLTFAQYLSLGFWVLGLVLYRYWRKSSGAGTAAPAE